MIIKIGLKSKETEKTFIKSPVEIGQTVKLVDEAGNVICIGKLDWIQSSRLANENIGDVWLDPLGMTRFWNGSEWQIKD